MGFLGTAGEWATRLPHHVARKKIPFMDLRTGETVVPDGPNGIKMEQFVFDVFDLVGLDRFGVFEVDRREEFSPLKNGRGSKEDNPETSRRDVLLQGRRWIEKAGGSVLDDGDKDAGVEISPLVPSSSKIGKSFCHGGIDFRFRMRGRGWSLCRERRSRLRRLLWTKGNLKSCQNKAQEGDGLDERDQIRNKCIGIMKE